MVRRSSKKDVIQEKSGSEEVLDLPVPENGEIMDLNTIVEQKQEVTPITPFIDKYSQKDREKLSPIKKCILHYSYIFENIKILKLNKLLFEHIKDRSLKIDSLEKLENLKYSHLKKEKAGSVKFIPYNRIFYRTDVNNEHLSKYDFLLFSLFYYFYFFNMSYRVRLKTVNDLETEWFNKELIPEEDEKSFDIILIDIPKSYLPTRYTTVVLQRDIERYLNANKSVFIMTNFSENEFKTGSYGSLVEILDNQNFEKFLADSKLSKTKNTQKRTSQVI